MSRKAPAGKGKQRKKIPSKRKSSASRGAKSRSKRSKVWSWGWKIALVLLVIIALGGLWLNHEVQYLYKSHEWVLPAQVYSKPESLYKGRELTPDNLQKLLTLMRYRTDDKLQTPGSYYRHGSRFGIYTRGFRYGADDAPAQRLYLTIQNGKLTSLTTSGGRAVTLARLEPLQIGSIHPGFNQDRVFVTLDDVPPMLTKLLIDTEDRRFYEHIGISFRGMARAFYVDVTTWSLAQGGSTLTQQLVKNLWLTNERSIWRKLIEIPMAVLLELHYSKDKILQAYLNEVYLGQDGGRAIRGMGLGAQFYFGKPVADLSVPQCAMLVALLRGPSWYNPRQHPERAMNRRNEVLHNAVEAGDMTPAEYEKLSAEPLSVVAKGRSALYAFPAFIDLVKRQLARDYSQGDLSRDGLIVRSTLDVLDQLAAEKALSNFLAGVDPKGKKNFNGAVVLVSPNQGDVLALVGDRKPRRAGFNRALDAKRPIGSLAKPVTVLTALARDEYTLATLVPDKPLSVPLSNGKVWTPDNYDHTSRGDIPLLEALVDSRNQAMAQVGMDVGPKAIVDTIHQLGIREYIPPYPSVSLGGFSLTPLQVAMLYQPLANGGFQTPLRSITAVLDSKGNPLARYPALSNQVIKPGLAYLTEWAMQKVVSEGTGRYAGKRLPQLHLAGKTGTTNNWRDSWFAGFSGSSLAVVWIGRDQDKSTGLTGATGALRVWTQVMKAVPQQPLRLSQPGNVSKVWMDPDGVRASGKGCSGSLQYPMLTASLPTDSDACGAVGDVKKGVVHWFKQLFE